MKTIVHKDNKESKYLLEDSKPIIIEAHQITVGSNPVDFYVGDMIKGGLGTYYVLFLQMKTYKLLYINISIKFKKKFYN